MRILIPFWRGVPERCFYQDFHTGIDEALRELGHEPIQFQFADWGKIPLEEADALYRILEQTKPDAVLDLACWGYALSRFTVPTADRGRQPIVDALGIPWAGLLFDQPYNQAIHCIVATRLYGVYPDLGHPQQVKRIYPGIKLTGEIFAPPAIRPLNDRSAERWSCNRDIDVLYVGNLELDATQRYWRDQVNRQWPAGFDPEFCDALADTVLENPERSLHLSLQAAVAGYKPLPADFDFASHLRCVEYCFRHVFRRDAVLALAQSGVRMQVVGKEWSKLALPSNVACREPMDYDGLFQLAGGAKICLDASTYLDGANDRVFSYALNRAVCFTNAAGYLRSAFRQDGGVRFYSMRNLSALGEEIKALLALPETLGEMGERASAAVLSAHTWRDRMTTILDAMRSSPGSASR